jgi:hypothetical protein
VDRSTAIVGLPACLPVLLHQRTAGHPSCLAALVDELEHHRLDDICEHAQECLSPRNIMNTVFLPACANLVNSMLSGPRQWSGLAWKPPV